MSAMSYERISALRTQITCVHPGEGSLQVNNCVRSCEGSFDMIAGDVAQCHLNESGALCSQTICVHPCEFLESLQLCVFL